MSRQGFAEVVEKEAAPQVEEAPINMADENEFQPWLSKKEKRGEFESSIVEKNLGILSALL